MPPHLAIQAMSGKVKSDALSRAISKSIEADVSEILDEQCVEVLTDLFEQARSPTKSPQPPQPSMKEGDDYADDMPALVPLRTSNNQSCNGSGLMSPTPSTVSSLTDDATTLVKKYLGDHSNAPYVKGGLSHYQVRLERELKVRLAGGGNVEKVAKTAADPIKTKLTSLQANQNHRNVNATKRCLDLRYSAGPFPFFLAAASAA